MSLKYVILGLLSEHPFSGYDLKKMFDTSARYFWSAPYSQIYRTLNQITKDGLATVELVQQTDVPNKKIYSITEKGIQELRQWLTAPQELLTVRHPLVAQLSWADMLEHEEIIALLEAYAEKVQERLQLFQNKRERSLVDEHARSERERYLWTLTVERGIMSYECELEWIRRCIEGLKQFSYGEE